MLQLERVISGDQTGVDQLGLGVARSLGIPTGGIAPNGYLTETGPNSRLWDEYGLAEHSSAEYAPRTRANVQQSDGTVLFSELSDGTRLTLGTCIRENKPYIVNPTVSELSAWLAEHQIKVLNVSGNRASDLTWEQMQAYRRILMDALTTNRRLNVLFAEQPAQWGLRGDPFLWEELARVGETLLLPSSRPERYGPGSAGGQRTGTGLSAPAAVRLERH